MIKEIEIDGEKVYIKKSGLGFKVVKPIKLDINLPFRKGNINWKNLIAGGSWYNLIGIGVVVISVVLILLDYSHAIKTANECLNQTNTFKIIP